MDVSSVKVKGMAFVLIPTCPVLLADIASQPQKFSPKPLKLALITYIVCF